MATHSLDFFGTLSPVEAAILWFSASPSRARSEYEATVNVRSNAVQITLPVPNEQYSALEVAVPKVTLVLAAILVDQYVNSPERLYHQKVWDGISSFLEHFVSTRGKHLLSFSDCDEIMTAFISQVIRPAKTTPSDREVSIEEFRSDFKIALDRLEDLGLIEDPPWKKLGLGALVILLGVIPVDFSVRTEQGENLVRTVRIEAPLWDYQKLSSSDEESWQVRIRAVDFAGETLRKLAEQYIQTWDRVQQNRLNPRPRTTNVKLDSEP